MQAEEVIVFSDSQLVVNQLSGEYEARDDRMARYLEKAKELVKCFKTIRVEQVARELNNHADALAGLATALETEDQRTIWIEHLARPSIEEEPAEQVFCADLGPSWMDPIVAYLKDDKLPANKKEAHKVIHRSARFWLAPSGKLYKRSFSGPYLYCVHPSIVENFLYEIHQGSCGSHAGGRSLAHRALTQGYWWPRMFADSTEYVKKCDKCQKFSPAIHQPAEDLTPLTSPWPFAQWGLDIVGPFHTAPGGVKYFIAATDYFTKWVEAEPLSSIEDTDVKRFVWRYVVSRFGAPRAIISDNGTQFVGKVFKSFCAEHGIKFYNSTPSYPQSNGQAEASNKTILDGIKKRLEKAKGKWAEELYSVLWAYRTTPRRPTGQTPYSLVYGVEAVIPLEVGLPTARTEAYDLEKNAETLARDLDLAEERRDAALIRLAAYQQELSRSYNKRVRQRIFMPGELVLRKVVGNTRKPSEGKLGANWEGPYRVTKVAGTGAYGLEDLEGRAIPRPWNAANLRKYYH